VGGGGRGGGEGGCGEGYKEKAKSSEFCLQAIETSNFINKYM
jgi:hypothetical protein